MLRVHKVHKELQDLRVGVVHQDLVVPLAPITLLLVQQALKVPLVDHKDKKEPKVLLVLVIQVLQVLQGFKVPKEIQE